MRAASVSIWITHLREPLVLVGFVVMLFAAIITTLIKLKALRRGHVVLRAGSAIKPAESR